MKPIGGFFELEIPRDGEPWHSAALALTSGRAALRVIYETLKPRRVFYPFYTCDTALVPARTCGIEVAFYPLTSDLQPDLQRGPGADECLVYINYFGLRGTTSAQVARAYGRRAIIDDTQAFFSRGYDGAWSFNSARKFFGVPDGGYLYPAEAIRADFAPNRAICTSHLISRLNGDLETAFAQFQASEAQITDAPLGMSAVSHRLLAAVDYGAAAERRRDNYRQLHDHFGAQNQLTLLQADGGEVPFCYPLRMKRRITRGSLWQQKLFVPQLWPEVIVRAGDGYRFERTLADELLPLPIDHRYDTADMRRVTHGIDEVAD
jgi:hypothetical protein